MYPPLFHHFKILVSVCRWYKYASMSKQYKCTLFGLLSVTHICLDTYTYTHDYRAMFFLLSLLACPLVLYLCISYKNKDSCHFYNIQSHKRFPVLALTAFLAPIAQCSLSLGGQSCIVNWAWKSLCPVNRGSWGQVSSGKCRPWCFLGDWSLFSNVLSTSGTNTVYLFLLASDGPQSD